MKTPDVTALSDAIRACVEPYLRANQGSEEHPLGHAELGSIQDLVPSVRGTPSVKGGFALRFKDGTTFLVNVHEIPGSKPGFQAPPAQGA
jgi:hypothetical protein